MKIYIVSWNGLTKVVSDINCWIFMTPASAQTIWHAPYFIHMCMCVFVCVCARVWACYVGVDYDALGPRRFGPIRPTIYKTLYKTDNIFMQNLNHILRTDLRNIPSSPLTVLHRSLHVTHIRSSISQILYLRISRHQTVKITENIFQW